MNDHNSSPEQSVRLERSEWLGPQGVEAFAGVLNVRVPFGVNAPIPPLWHWFYLLERRPQRDIGPDGHPRTGIPSPPAHGLRRMFAGGRVTTRHTLLIGETATRITSVSEPRRKVGRTGVLTFVTVKHEFWQFGRVAIREEQDIVYRDYGAPSLPSSSGGVSQSEVGRSPNLRHVAGPSLSIAVDEALLFRFSALTYNAHRIHYDKDWASQEGYPGLVIHGPLQAILMAELMRREGVSLIGQTYQYRLTAPLVGPQKITVAPVEDGLSHGAQVYSAAGKTCAVSNVLPPRNGDC